MIVSGFTQRSTFTDEDLAEFPGCHSHCFRCRLTKCTHPVDNVTACDMTTCQGCGFTFHKCKAEEHALTCLEERVPCINACYGCPHFMKRSHLPTHLPVCPASVVACGQEWNRWPMYTKDAGVKHDIPPTKTYIDCGQLDVALAMRDQRMLFDSLRAPKRLIRTLRNPLTQKYPAAPLTTQRSLSLDSPGLPTPDGDRSQTVSDDDTDAPWDLSRRQPGLKESICSHFFPVSKETKEKLMSVLKIETLNTSSLSSFQNSDSPSSSSPLTGASEKNLTPGSKITQCSITKNAQSQEPCKEKAPSDSKSARGSVSPDKDRSRSVSVLRDFGGSQLDKILGVKLGDENDNSGICLHKVLGVNLTHDVINSYVGKPVCKYTFLCAQNFRRDQYKWHMKNVHQDIISQIDGYLEQRCPLAYAGCPFSFQRLIPSQPDTVLHFSWLLESFGLKSTAQPCSSSLPPSSSSHSLDRQDDVNQSQRSQDTKSGNLNSKNSSSSSSSNQVANSISDLANLDRQFDELKVDVNNTDEKTRQEDTTESTSTSVQPVLFTGYNPDSKVLLVYNIEETYCDTSSQSYGLGDLPFEVLQQIARRLDSFSLCNLSLTSCFLRDVCCSLLGDLGIVMLNWQRKKIGDKISWEVVDKRWIFTTSFEPIKSWKINSDHVAIGDHLKTCPFNQDKVTHSGAQPLFQPSA